MSMMGTHTARNGAEAVSSRTPNKLSPPMRHVQSRAVVDFCEIYDEDVEMVSVGASPSETLSAAVTALLDERGLQSQWVHQGTADSGPAAQGRREVIIDALREVHRDLELPVEVLRELLGCESCGVRIKVLDGPMCPRFHVDKVPCRMLMTYAGPGTEWIAHQDVDWHGFAEGDPHPTRAGAQVQHLRPGTWSLLKGGNWDGDFGGVVHRSPRREDRRLLVSLDPIFSD